MNNFNPKEFIDDIQAKSDGILEPLFSTNIFLKDIFLQDYQRDSIFSYLNVRISDYIVDPLLSNYTGDVKGFASIHRIAAFDVLTSQIERAVVQYLSSLCKVIDKIQIYHQKSWPVFLKKDTSVSVHSHSNAHISAIYYFDISSNEGGDLVFHSPFDLGLPSNANGVEFFYPKYYLRAIKPYTGMLVVFPSILRHEVTKYLGETPRISFSYDFTLTASPRLGSGSVEMLAPAIETWLPFKA